MCGIAGIVYQNSPGEQKVSDEITAMTNAVQHRGPDGDGFFIADHVALGHRRLSIIDVSDLGKQPMNWNNRYWITFNGEIYNYIEIRQQLVEMGYSFTSHSDTEVMLAAYDKWGYDAVLHFNGMWAFAIYDTVKKTVFCSRDRFGVKPFYYAETNGRFIFGSEVRQLLPLMNSISPRYDILLNYLILNMSDYSSDTFFEGIRKLSGGHNLIYNTVNNQFTISKYYTLAHRPEVAKLKEAEAVDYYTSEFKRSIMYRLRSDVKVGTCLSGGLDSSAIAAFAAKEYNRTASGKFCAITAESVQQETNEYKYAEQVVNHCNLDWHVTTPGHQAFEKVLRKVIEVQEYPFISPSVYMQYFVMEEAKKAGITVLLDGQGADEVLLGYPRYTVTQASQHGLLNFLGQLPRIKNNYAISYSYLIQSYLYYSMTGLRKLRQRNIFPGLVPQYRKMLDNTVYKKYSDAQRSIKQLQKLEIFETQVPQLLRFEDKNSMAHSIETRLPFLDWELVEISLSLNDNLKIHNGWSKYILRKTIAPELPESIVWRKNKIGFAAPINVWLAGNETAMQKAIAGSEILNRFFDNKVPGNMAPDKRWRLYCLALWEDVVLNGNRAVLG